MERSGMSILLKANVSPKTILFKKLFSLSHQNNFLHFGLKKTLIDIQKIIRKKLQGIFQARPRHYRRGLIPQDSL